MSPSERRRRWQAQIRAQARARGRQVDAAVLHVGGTLVELQQQIRAALAALPTDFDQYRLPELLREVDRHLAVWERRAWDAAADGLDAGWRLAPQIIDGPLRAVQADLGGMLLPESLLEALKSEVASKLRAVGELAQKRIQQTLRLGAIGGRTPHEMMVDVGRNLRSPGPFKFVAFRAEVIVRTEVGRLHSMAGDLRMQQAAQLVPGLQKQWLWSGVSRMTHSMASGQVRDLDENFLVGGEYLAFPRDPDASPENTIACGCESVPYKADWATEPIGGI